MLKAFLCRMNEAQAVLFVLLKAIFYQNTIKSPISALSSADAEKTVVIFRGLCYNFKCEINFAGYRPHEWLRFQTEKQ